MQNVSVVCFLASYLLAFGCEWLRIRRDSVALRLASIGCSAAGLVAHSWYLMARSGVSNRPPLLNSSHDWLLVLAMMAALFVVVLAIVSPRLPAGLYLYPMVFALIVAAYFVSRDANQLTAADYESKDAVRGWAMLHATLLVFGIAGVMSGFVLSLMYLVQHNRLKQKHAAQPTLKLPSLERLGRWNRWAIILSVPLLALGMLTGGVLIFISRKSSQAITFQDPVVVTNLSMLVIMVLFLIWTGLSQNQHGRHVAWLTLFAFGFLLIVVIGLQVLTGSGLLPTGHGLRLSSFASTIV